MDLQVADFLTATCEANIVKSERSEADLGVYYTRKLLHRASITVYH